MRFTWHIAKNRLNFRRHRIIFEEAIRIFDGATVEKIDERFDYGELRMYAIGLVNGTEVTVIYTDRQHETRHIISAWKSTPNERRAFWEEIEKQNR